MSFHPPGRSDDGRRQDASHGAPSEDARNRYKVQLDGLTKLSELAVEGRLDELLAAVADVLRDGLEADAARVLEWEEDQQSFSLRASSGHAHLSETDVEVSFGQMSAADRTLRDDDEVVIIEDFDEDSGASRLAPLDADDFKSSIEIRIPGRERPFGVIGAQSRNRAAFGPPDVSFVRAIANTAGQALEQDRQRRVHEETIERYERTMEARDDVLSIISHDLRSPASAIKLSLEVVRRAATGEKGPIAPEQVERAVEKANENLDRMLVMLDDLVSLNETEVDPLDMDFEQVDLREVVENTLLLYSGPLERAGSQLNLHGDTSVVGCWDPMRLQQIVSNLVSNAIKYGEGSPITVELRGDEQTATLRVIDRGRGIPEELHDRIFERFVRVDHKENVDMPDSYGLGLWIVGRIVEALGGKIELDSTPGEGTSFAITLPREPDSATDASMPGGEPPRSAPRHSP